MLCPVLGSSEQNTQGTTGENSAKGPQRCLRDLSYEGRLWKLGLFSLEKRKLRGLIHISKCLKGLCKEDRARLFPVVPSDRTIVSRHKLKHGKFLLNFRKCAFHCEGWLSTGTGYQYRSWSLNSWRYSKAVWEWSCTTHLQWPCWSRGIAPNYL